MRNFLMFVLSVVMIPINLVVVASCAVGAIFKIPVCVRVMQTVVAPWQIWWSVQKLRRTNPELFFEFEGQRGLVDPNWIETILGVRGDFFTAAYCACGFSALIVTTKIPDLRNLEHVTVLQHEMGHIRAKDWRKVQTAYIATGESLILIDAEIAADEYAASKVGVDLVKDMLIYFLDVTNPECHEALQMRWAAIAN